MEMCLISRERYDRLLLSEENMRRQRDAAAMHVINFSNPRSPVQLLLGGKTSVNSNNSSASQTLQP
jgi:hypothetical protein